LKRQSLQPRVGENVVLKQRSPADGRWAVKLIHRIEKMRHVECYIVGVGARTVKLTLGDIRVGCHCEIEEKTAKVLT